MKQYKKICKIITDRIIGLLKKGVVPWQKPWKGGAYNIPRSVSTKKHYQGTNLTLLSCAGYSSPWFLTYGQAKNLGGQVKKGEKSLPVTYWKFYDEEVCTGYYNSSLGCAGKSCGKCSGTGKYKPMPNLFSFNVFNALQCEKLPEKYYKIIKKKEELIDFTPIKDCEEIIKNYPNKPKIAHDQNNRCFYRPSADAVHMVKPEKFISKEEYYSTFFHELIHSTGHKSRLNREGVSGTHFFGSHEYSKEELVAELGSTFLCGISGIDRSSVIKNSASYIKSWKSKLSKNEDWILWAGSRSSKAVEYILNK